MKALQELVPNANKVISQNPQGHYRHFMQNGVFTATCHILSATSVSQYDYHFTDKASMLDEIIDYVKFLQLQVKVLSMSRLGGAAAVAPLVADISSEGGGGDCIQANTTGGGGGTQPASSNDSLTVTEHQVAKLMEEDMGSAMQYLQGKGLCLMPISLANAISSATRNPMIGSVNGHTILSSNGDGPSSPSMSVLTVQSATMGNGGGSGVDCFVKDSNSVSKP